MSLFDDFTNSKKKTSILQTNPGVGGTPDFGAYKPANVPAPAPVAKPAGGSLYDKFVQTKSTPSSQVPSLLRSNTAAPVQFEGTYKDVTPVPEKSFLQKAKDYVVKAGSAIINPVGVFGSLVSDVAEEPAKQVVKGLVQQYTDPSVLTLQMENDVPNAMKPVLVPILRTVMPAVEPLVNDITTGIIFNNRELTQRFNEISQSVVFDGTGPKLPGTRETDVILDTLHKSNVQVVGDVAQAVLGAYAPSIFGKSMDAFAAKGVSEALAANTLRGAEFGFTFGVAQAMSSGSNDPKELFKIVAQSTAAGAVLNLGISTIGHGIFRTLPDALTKMSENVKLSQIEPDSLGRKVVRNELGEVERVIDERGKTIYDAANPFEEVRAEADAVARRPKTAQEAADIYWNDVIQKKIDKGEGITIGADDLKDYFGKDYDDARHPIYSKAVYETILPRALKADKNTEVVIVGGGPASAKTEGIINKVREGGFTGIIYDSNASNKAGIFKLIDDIRAAGKEPLLIGVIPDVTRSADFAFTRERKVNEEAFTRGHTGFPEVARAAIAEGKLTPDDVRLLDTRGMASLEEIRTGDFAKDPVALLSEVRYDDKYVRRAYQAAEKNSRMAREARSGQNRDVSGSAGVRESRRKVGKVEKPASSENKPSKKETKANQSRVFERLKSEFPEELKGELTYEKINLKEQAEKAVDLIEKDKQKAFRVAMGAEVSKDVTSTAVNIAMAEKALTDGNTSLFTRLVKNRSLEQTRRGQEIVSEKGSVSDNSVQHFVRELIATRLEFVGKKYLGDVRLSKMTNKQKGIEIIDKEVRKAQTRIKGKELDLAAAQKLIDSLSC